MIHMVPLLPQNSWLRQETSLIDKESNISQMSTAREREENRAAIVMPEKLK